MENPLGEKLRQRVKEVLVKLQSGPLTTGTLDGAVGLVTAMLLARHKVAPGVQLLLDDQKQLIKQVKKMLQVKYAQQAADAALNYVAISTF